MKKPLLLAGHNDLSQSTFSATVLSVVDESTVEVARLGDQLKTRGFDPVHEVARLAAANRVMVLFPLHWYGPPSTLVRWTEDALQSVKGCSPYSALSGKPVQLVVSTGGSEQEYRDGRRNKRPVVEYLAGLHMTFEYFGAVIEAPIVFHAAWRLNDAEMREIGYSLIKELALS